MSTGSVVVVTGAAGALGSALARYLVGQGRRVVALDRPESQERLIALGKELGASALLGLEADLTLASEWAWVMEHISAKFDTPAGAVLAAGGWAGGTPLHAAADDSAWESMMQSNAETVYRAMRALVPP
ncbi:MAG TPA: SDR family NAD(P)-dependent oxidoreductase, partial [Polyangiaceae bacterium]|nr:SDR family NAD(P)-dependent oxidoreductase [Polyangiaceae bacterium]